MKWGLGTVVRGFFEAQEVQAMTFTATYRRALSYQVGDRPAYLPASTTQVNIIAASPLQAEVNARRIASERGWQLLDVQPVGVRLDQTDVS